MKLASNDLLILFLYLLVVVGIGLMVRSSVKTAADFFQAGRKLPLWLGTLAFLGAGLGAPEVLGFGAAAAQYGLHAAFLVLAAIPALLFAGICMMPVYYGANARSLPEFLGLRFDGKARALAAVAFALMTILISGVGLLAMARAFQALHVFDGLFRAYGAEPAAIFRFTIGLTAIVVLACVLLGGLASTVYAQAVQFCVLVVALLPVVFNGLRTVGGWSGLQAALPSGFTLAGTGGVATGVEIAALALLLGAAYWSSDFRVVQVAMAAKDLQTARRIPLFAAAAALVLPLLLVVPSVIAVALPTPQTHTIERIENGAIIHETTVVRPEIEAGRGLVPAIIDTRSGKVAVDSAGHAPLDFAMALPEVLLHFVPNGLLGLGLAALLACLMSGMTASVMAFSTVFTWDLGALFRRSQPDAGRPTLVGRLAALGAVLFAVGVANALAGSGDVLVLLLTVFSIVGVPLFLAALAGMFWRRATSQGAFAGMAAGVVAGLLHHGLTLPAGGAAGVQGGWLAVAHTYSNGVSHALGTAGIALFAAVVVLVAASFFTVARPESELASVMYLPISRSRRR